MQIQIASKGIDVSQALRERISEKLEEMMDKYIHRDGDAQVSVAREAQDFGLFVQFIFHPAQPWRLEVRRKMHIRPQMRP